ncbi:hypothetical protein GF378_00700, partial [Candidatus Pacearchaeota archaeon]|nr:hypothetical protein [Candidatus Pacearchaeota archaeon]
MKISKKQAKQICEKLNAMFKKIYLLGKGCHNENFILSTDKGKYVVRIKINKSDRILQEYKFLKKLKGKFGPKVYFLDSS